MHLKVRISISKGARKEPGVLDGNVRSVEQCIGVWLTAKTKNAGDYDSLRQLLLRLATPMGFEPTISTVTGWHVRPLHHGAALTWCSIPSSTPGVKSRKCATGPT